jgi:hypothetical protein
VTAPREDGTCLADHLRAAARQLERDEEEFIREKGQIPDPPERLMYLFSHFTALSRARGTTGFGPAPITYHDISAYRRVVGFHPLPWEVDVLMALDSAWFEVRRG